MEHTSTPAKFDAIVYTSNSGYTAQYAAMLEQALQLPCFRLESCTLPKETRVLFLGWLMAGSIHGLKQAEARFTLAAVCAVGLSRAPERDLRRQNPLGSLPVFALQGGYDGKKLRGLYKWTMRIVTKSLIRKISGQAMRTEADEAMLSVLRHGGSFVSEAQLLPVLEWAK